MEGRGALQLIGRSEPYLVLAPRILPVGQIDVFSQLRGGLVEILANKTTLDKQNKREITSVMQVR
jgi:hypothetical protein